MGRTGTNALARRTLSALLTLVATATFALVAAAPAQASTVSFGFNSFGSHEISVWKFSSSPGSGNSAFVEFNSPNPLSGVNNGALLASNGGSAALSRQVNITERTVSANCRWSAWVQATSNAWVVMVVSNPATGGMLAQETYQFPVSLPATSGYVPLESATYFAPTSLSTVEISVILVAPNSGNVWARVDRTSNFCVTN